MNDEGRSVFAAPRSDGARDRRPPDRHQVRFVQQGIPARGYWGVSFVELGPDGAPAKVEVFLVDARTGDVTRSQA